MQQVLYQLRRERDEGSQLAMWLMADRHATVEVCWKEEDNSKKLK